MADGLADATITLEAADVEATMGAMEPATKPAEPMVMMRGAMMVRLMRMIPPRIIPRSEGVRRAIVGPTDHIIVLCSYCQSQLDYL